MSGYFDHARQELLRHLPDSARRVLDVGCGEGALATGMSRREEREVWGVELDPGAAKVAEERLDRVLVGDAETQVAGLPDAYFDCIFCNDVLEHLVWPERTLETLRAKLAPGGRLVSSVPNVRHFWTVWDLAIRGRWDYADEGILDRTHLRFYTKATMREMFEARGFRVVHVEGLNPLRSLKYRLFHWVTFGRFAEMGYLQYVWVLEVLDARAASPV